MVTKKSAAPPPADLPAVLRAVERNKYLGRVKASLAKTWSPSRTDSISGATQLAWFLVALGREAEARELADLVADAAPRGSDRASALAASSAIGLAARLARLGGDEARRASLVDRLVAGSAAAAAPLGPAALSDAEKDVRSAEVDPSQKHACQGFAQGCARAAYLGETAAAGVDVEAVERIISQGLDGLRAQLSR